MNEKIARNRTNKIFHNLNLNERWDWAEAYGYLKAIKKAKRLEKALKYILGIPALSCMTDGECHKGLFEKVTTTLAQWGKEK